MQGMSGATGRTSMPANCGMHGNTPVKQKSEVKTEAAKPQNTSDVKPPNQVSSSKIDIKL